jgi:hypothetical protein
VNPTTAQTQALEGQLSEACWLYNAALQERRDAYRTAATSLTYYDTATKARLLLMACLLRFGSLPPAADPLNPTPAELQAVQAKLAEYQAVFDTH